MVNREVLRTELGRVTEKIKAVVRHRNLWDIASPDLVALADILKAEGLYAPATNRLDIVYALKALIEATKELRGVFYYGRRKASEELGRQTEEALESRDSIPDGTEVLDG